MKFVKKLLQQITSKTNTLEMFMENRTNSHAMYATQHLLESFTWICIKKSSPGWPKKLQMWFMWKVLRWIRISEETHQDNPWGTKKLQMWFLWKNLHYIRWSEKTHQDSPWGPKKLQMWILWQILHSIRKSKEAYQETSWRTK